MLYKLFLNQVQFIDCKTDLRVYHNFSITKVSTKMDCDSHEELFNGTKRENHGLESIFRQQKLCFWVIILQKEKKLVTWYSFFLKVLLCNVLIWIMIPLHHFVWNCNVLELDMFSLYRYTIAFEIWFSEIIESDAKLVFDDVVDEFCSVAGIMKRFENWRNTNMESYKEAYASLNLTKILGPILRLKLLMWNPLQVRIFY